MRKLFFVLAFALVGMFAFANNIGKTSTIKTEVITIEEASSFNIKSNVEFYKIDDYFTRCRLTYNFVNAEGETQFTVSYSVTLSSGTCEQALDVFRDDAIAAYYDYMG